MPCDAFPTPTQRWHPPPPLDDAALLAHCAQRGLLPPTVRLLAKGEVNGPGAHPVWTWLKVSFRDTADVGGNFGKWLITADGHVYGRYTPLLRPSLLRPAIDKLLSEGRARAARPAASGHAPAGQAAAPLPPLRPVSRQPSSPDTGRWGSPRGLSGEL